MEYRGYNDYELLYMINDCKSDLALEIMMKKYEGLMVNKIKTYYFEMYELEDLIFIAKTILLKAIKTFRPSEAKTFTKYYDLLLHNELISLLRKDVNNRVSLINYDDVDQLNASLEEVELPIITSDDILLFRESFSEFEDIIFNEYFMLELSIDDINKKYGLDYTKISNTISRIKKKIKEIYFKHHKNN